MAIIFSRHFPECFVVLDRSSVNIILNILSDVLSVYLIIGLLSSLNLKYFNLEEILGHNLDFSANI